VSAPAPALEARIETEVGSGASTFRLAVELRLERGVLVLFGPSAAGKTLTLHALAGLVPVHDGLVRVGGEALFDRARSVDVPAHRRRIGWVPQHHALFPFCDVEANVAFGLRRGARRRGSAAVRALLEELGIAHLARARPDSLSGGERQRVALARALAVGPRLLLLDEPFASIDRAGRAALWRSLGEVLARRATPAVLVTHDPEEALRVGDEVVRIAQGRSVASGPPGEVIEAGRRVVLRARRAAPASPLPGERARAALSEAEVEGPRALLEGCGDGLELSLHAAPEDDVP
jgi:molybdate transport system ATP-binding protein